MPGSDLLDVVRPFVWLALAAFFAGVMSYVVLGRTHAAAHDQVQAAAYAPSASAPTSNAWNRPKRI